MLKSENDRLKSAVEQRQGFDLRGSGEEPINIRPYKIIVWRFYILNAAPLLPECTSTLGCKVSL